MEKKYLLKSTFKIARVSRLLAKCIDLFIVLLLSFFFYPLGILLSAIYIGVCDSLQDGQSVGKKIIGFCVISLEDGTPCSVKQSFIRNLPILIPLLFLAIPVWGWIFALFIGTPLIGLEIYLLFKLDSGLRLGDVMADTTVMAPIMGLKKYGHRKSSWFEANNVRPSLDNS